ncbi:MAG: SIS domain-containing protein [Thermoplasmata archaeon]
MRRPSPPGLSRMRALLAQLPEHLQSGFRDGVEASRGLAGPRARPTFVVGLGGSGISADLARVVVERETKVPFTVVRTSGLPSTADRDGLAVLLSHSGNTWETLRAYDDARRRSMRIVVLSSGGELARRAEVDGVALVLLNPDMPQRSSVGLTLGGLLGILDAWFPESNEGRIERIAGRLGPRVSRLSRRQGPPSRLAVRLGGRLPFIYADAPLLPIARRWATQVEENAKRLAAFDEVPEAYHNAIVGWDHLDRRSARRFATVLLEWDGSSPTVVQGNRYLERLLVRRGAVAARVHFSTEDLLEALLEGIAFGDLMSLELAEAGRVDPVPVDAIARYKDHLSRTTRSS